MSCGVGEVTERLENEQSSQIQRYTAELILQPFRHFTYVTAHSPTLPSLYLRHSSFSNPSVSSPTSQFILEPFFRFFYVTSSSLNSPGEPSTQSTVKDLYFHLTRIFYSKWERVTTRSGVRAARPLVCPYWDLEFEFWCRPWDNCGGQCRDCLSFSRGSPVFQILSHQYSPHFNLPLFI